MYTHNCKTTKHGGSRGASGEDAREKLYEKGYRQMEYRGVNAWHLAAGASGLAHGLHLPLGSRVRS
jgi:hypothetical protein